MIVNIYVKIFTNFFFQFIGSITQNKNQILNQQCGLVGEAFTYC